MSLKQPNNMEYNMAIPRPDKALKNLDKVTQVEPDTFLVQSTSRPNLYYTINREKLECQCEDTTFNQQHNCWHVRAVKMFQERVNGIRLK
jgi:hypothetical protein